MNVDSNVCVLEDIFGSMMTYLEKDVLPFPHVKRIDLGPEMKRKVIHAKQTKSDFCLFLFRILLKRKSLNMPMNFLFH
jgi:hypothetical protein